MGPHGYGLRWAIDDVHDCLTEMLAMTGHANKNGQIISHAVSSLVAPPTEVINGDARNLPLEDASVDCVVFDPPYEENVNYAELSDFFYVWLKRTAGYVFPDDLTDYLTEKDQEAISSPARFRNRATKGQSAKNAGPCRVPGKNDRNLRRVPPGRQGRRHNDCHVQPQVQRSLGLHHRCSNRSRLRHHPHLAGQKLRRRSQHAHQGQGRSPHHHPAGLPPLAKKNPFPKPWHEVEELIAQAVRDDIRDNLSQADLKPIDLYLSAFGPALRVISEHWGTEREIANLDRIEAPFAVTPTDALQVARREVSRHRAQEISREWTNNPVDVATKFYILAQDATEGDTLMFDEANLLARALGVRLEKNDAAMKRIVAFKADKVTLLSARDRLAARQISEDIQASTTLDVVQTAVALTDRRNSLDAEQWLNKRLHDPNDRRFRATLEALIPNFEAGPRRPPSSTQPVANTVRRRTAEAADPDDAQHLRSTMSLTDLELRPVYNHGNCPDLLAGPSTSRCWPRLYATTAPPTPSRPRASSQPPRALQASSTTADTSD